MIQIIRHHPAQRIAASGDFRHSVAVVLRNLCQVGADPLAAWMDESKTTAMATGLRVDHHRCALFTATGCARGRLAPPAPDAPKKAGGLLAPFTAMSRSSSKNEFGPLEGVFGTLVIKQHAENGQPRLITHLLHINACCIHIVHIVCVYSAYILRIFCHTYILIAHCLRIYTHTHFCMHSAMICMSPTYVLHI